MSMWEPFTDPARRVIVEALEVAQRFASPEIEAEHIFVGIAEVGESPAAEALGAFGVSPQRVDDAAERVLSHGKGGRPTEMVFTSRAKRVIERGFEEARRLNHRHIGSEHLLLGYLREQGRKSEILAELGLHSDALRSKLLDLLPNESPAEQSRGTQRTDALEDCFAWLGRGKTAELRPDALWDGLNGAAAERNVAAVLVYAFLLARESGWNAQETARQIVDAAKRRFDN